MATLILTTVGTAVGGPIGAALGAIVGQQIDNALFAPKRRHGPRLGDLAIQTSSYGTQIPKIFGTMRVAGTVIWATDLKEERTNSGGGKGQPKTVNYSYSASFAVALSGRQVRAVRRIWADGKLLRGEAGDFKSRTGFRFYPGSESQAVDPLIASLEGTGQAPAHRGVAYALFEDFQLADYGNRIPSLTFEVEADAGSVAVGTIAEELSGGEIRAGETPELAGYAASGDGVRGTIESLGEALPLSLVEGGDHLLLTTSAGIPALIRYQEQGAQGVRGGGGRTQLSRSAAGSVAGEVTITYYDATRDYQTGIQRASRGISTTKSERLTLPAVLSAGDAKSLAEQRLACLWANRQSGELHLPWHRSGIRAGAHVRIEGVAGLWKVARWTLDRMVTSIEVWRVRAALRFGGGAGNPGRAVAEPDLLNGPTTLFILDVPNISDGLAERPVIVAAAAGASDGWRGASLMSSIDRGASWKPEAAARAPAIMGRTIDKLEPAGSALIDARRAVVVELLNESMWLESRSDDALVAGANLAVLGSELVQFGRVEPLGNSQFRLTRLLRGRRGSEPAAMEHHAGEPFLLLDASTVSVIEPVSGSVGGNLWVSAQGIGDGDQPVLVKTPIEAQALMPPSPVHLRAERSLDGGVTIRWTRRSRNGWAWLSGSEAPLGEESEAYRLVLRREGFERVISVESPFYVYTAGQQAEDGISGTLDIEVRQIGTHQPSAAARLNIHCGKETI